MASTITTETARFLNHFLFAGAGYPLHSGGYGLGAFRGAGDGAPGHYVPDSAVLPASVNPLKHDQQPPPVFGVEQMLKHRKPVEVLLQLKRGHPLAIDAATGSRIDLSEFQFRARIDNQLTGKFRHGFAYTGQGKILSYVQGAAPGTGVVQRYLELGGK